MNCTHPPSINPKSHYRKSAGAVSLIGASSLGLLGWTLIQQSPNNLNPIAQQPTTEQTAPNSQTDTNTPANPSLQEVPPDAKSDPLFQEIQRMILEKQSIPALTLGPATSDPTRASTLEQQSGDSPFAVDAAVPSISDAKWHAAESILAAARILEQDVAISTKEKKWDQVARIQALINQLRSQARQLLVP